MLFGLLRESLKKGGRGTVVKGGRGRNKCILANCQACGPAMFGIWAWYAGMWAFLDKGSRVYQPTPPFPQFYM